MKKVFGLILLFSLVLAACTSKAGPTMEGTPISGTYPGPQENPSAPVENGYPSGVPTDTLIQPPQVGDENLTRGEVFLESTQLLTQPTTPPQYQLQVSGSLPTPCHQIRAEVSAPDASGKIVVSLYSLVSPDQLCTQVLQPFTGSLSLGDLATGAYTVELNGVSVTQFDVP